MPLKGWRAWLTILLAIGLLISGTVSVFIVENGVGSAALIGAGLVLGAVALGYRLRKVHLPDGTVFELEEAQKRLSEGDEEGAAGVALDALKKASVSLPGITSGTSVGVYETAVRDLLRASLPDVSMSVAQSPGAAIFDFIIYGQRLGGLNVGVDVRGGTRLDPLRLAANYGAAIRSEAMSIDAIVVVARSSPDEAELETVQSRLRERLKALFDFDENRVRVLGWRLEDPASSLTDPLTAIVKGS
jgi:hypothetical protein